MSEISANAIDDAERALEEAQNNYLRRFGWTETSNTPGAYWLWRRDFADVDAGRIKWWETTVARKPPLGAPSKPEPYGVITAPRDLAVSMTRRALDDDLACDGCAKLLRRGDKGHLCREGEVLCAACAPSWADFEEQAKERIHDGDVDEQLTRSLESCAARRAEGLSMTDPMVFDL